MLLKGSKRGGAMQLAKHLINADENEHVTVHEVRGFVSDSITGALMEIYGVSRGTQCRQFMFSLSLNPPPDESVPASVFEETVERAEKKLKLDDQPRIMIFHEKEGRRHAHVVWSRIDVDEMIAIDQPYFKNRLSEISRSIYLEQNWKMPEGFLDKNKKNPLNFTRAEWQQALRINRKPQDIKREIQDAWAISDNKQSFERALNEMGYYLAKGDRRAIHMVVDLYGEAYPLYRSIGKTRKEIEARLGKASGLSSITRTKQNNLKQLKPTFDKHIRKLGSQHKNEISSLLHQKHGMTASHRNERNALEEHHNARWQQEETKRNDRIQRGFKGLWDKLTGKYWKIRKANEQQTVRAYYRDMKEREALINAQLVQRQSLQKQMDNLREKQDQEKQTLIRDFLHLRNYDQLMDKQHIEREWLQEFEHNDIEFESNDDFEPEL